MLPDSYVTPYRICARPGWNTDIVEVFAVPLRERLPRFPVPLRERGETVHLDLQAVFDPTYEHGDYDMTVDYTADPVPPLEPNDATWADELLREKGLR